MQLPREIIDGQILCSSCHTPRPVSWFDKDKHTKLGYGYRCAECRRIKSIKDAKVRMIEPESEIVPISEMPLEPPEPVKCQPGSWERIVRTAMMIPTNEVVFVRVRNDWNRHNAASAGLHWAANKLSVRINLVHINRGVYVMVRKTRKRKEDG